MKKIVLTTMAGLLLAAGPEAARACERCFGMADAETASAITMAMMALVVLTSVIWGGIGAFAYNLRRRARMLEPGALSVGEGGALVEDPPDADA